VPPIIAVTNCSVPIVPIKIFGTREKLKKTVASRYNRDAFSRDPANRERIGEYLFLKKAKELINNKLPSQIAGMKKIKNGVYCPKTAPCNKAPIEGKNRTGQVIFFE